MAKELMNHETNRSDVAQSIFYGILNDVMEALNVDITRNNSFPFRLA